jgi:hypothetical protein
MLFTLISVLQMQRAPAADNLPRVVDALALASVRREQGFGQRVDAPE